MASDNQPIIVIKKIKKGEHGHHGGAWKVAFADFVTALMAFFMVMWLVGSTTREQRAAIADYFKNPSAIQGPGGASQSMIKLGGSMDMPTGSNKPALDDMAKEQIEELADEFEQERMELLLSQLKQLIESNSALNSFKDQLLLDITSEGLRIQIVDKENRPMFDSGSDVLKDYTRVILREIVKTINGVPNKIGITGHTDRTPYTNKYNYTNWELSADRANAARRELILSGMQDDKIGRVVGLASSVLFNKEDPYDPMNRRISIVVMNKKAEAAVSKSEGK